MTVQFNTQASATYVAIDDLYQEIKHLVKTPPKKHAVLPLYLTRVYTTTSNKQPIKWEGFDVQVTSNDSLDCLNDSVKDWVKYCSDKGDWCGYKIVTMHVDPLNATATMLHDYCVEHWQPKEKVYINGPKKKPFPIKAAKHF